MGQYDQLAEDYRARKNEVKENLGIDKFFTTDQAVELLETVLEDEDVVCLEGNNQKQADFLARSLTGVDPEEVSDLHMVQSSLVLDEHMEVFEKGIASDLDFAFSGPQSKRLYKAVQSGDANVGAIHTYLELYGRYFVDLTPRVSLVVADSCDQDGNLFTGFNTEDTPLIAEATNFKNGLVIAQVKEKKDAVERVDIPADWVDYIVETGEDYHHQPLFTRDPARITDLQVLMAMLVMKGIYSEYNVQTLNHGLGFATAAVELLLPTYGKEIVLPEGCCSSWVLNPHPTLIPAIEAGIVEKVYPFGGEVGMKEYVSRRADIFPMGAAGHMRSSRANAHTAGLYGIDCFTGATMQIDKYGNSSTAIEGRIAGFGGAPNLGSTPPGRRHMTKAYKKTGRMEYDNYFGRKLVVQMTPTVSEKKGIPVFREQLDAYEMYEDGNFSAPPVMIDCEQLTHIVTERGIAYLDRCETMEEQMAAIRAIAGDTEIGRRADSDETASLREEGLVQFPEDLGIDKSKANTDLLAAESLEELVEISGGAYNPPEELL
ncbi:MAG: malonate decarboxylase subunit alpha [bacterium]